MTGISVGVRKGVYGLVRHLLWKLERRDAQSKTTNQIVSNLSTSLTSLKWKSSVLKDDVDYTHKG